MVGSLKNYDMLDRDLKNFSRYLGSLETYAKAAKIKIRYKEGDFTGGEYNHGSRIIYIDPTEPHKVQIACFLHELGHAFDDVLVYPEMLSALSRAYVKFYEEGCDGYQLSIITQCEKRAWDYGEALSKLLKIPLGKWYFQYRNESLRSYRKK